MRVFKSTHSGQNGGMASSASVNSVDRSSAPGFGLAQVASAREALPAPVWGSSAVEIVEAACEPAFAGHPGRVVTPSPDLCDFVAFSLTTIVEVLDGRRPMTQLQRIASRNVVSMVNRRRVLAKRLQARLAAGVLPLSRVLEQHAQCPMADVMEVAATVRHAGRIRAVCLRFEKTRSKWQIVHFSMA